MDCGAASDLDGAGIDCGAALDEVDCFALILFCHCNYYHYIFCYTYKRDINFIQGDSTISKKGKHGRNYCSYRN